MYVCIDISNTHTHFIYAHFMRVHVQNTYAYIYTCVYREALFSSSFRWRAKLWERTAISHKPPDPTTSPAINVPHPRGCLLEPENPCSCVMNMQRPYYIRVHSWHRTVCGFWQECSDGYCGCNTTHRSSAAWRNPLCSICSSFPPPSPWQSLIFFFLILFFSSF